MSASFSSRKLMTTCDTPSDELDRSSSMPLMVFTPSSILSVISVSTSSGAAPGRRVVTMTVGKSTFGKRSSPRRVKAKAPTTVRDRMMTVANTGRRTERAASHCMTESQKKASGLLDFDDLTVGQPALRIVGDDVTSRHPGCELDPIPDGLAGSDDAFLNLVALD